MDRKQAAKHDKKGDRANTGSAKEDSLSYDIILISGDAYVDHPYFGAALIKRFLESKGFTVAVIDQPDWKSNDDFLRFGIPRLFFGVTAGNMDSMVANYGPLKKPRDKDYYTPGGEMGKRPDRAILVYCNKLRELFGKHKNINGEKIPIILGGIEASLRRFAHYDYWDNNIRRSIVADSRADLLVYGMGEYAIWEIAQAIKDGKKISDIVSIKNTCYRSTAVPAGCKMLHPFESIKGNDEQSKILFNESFKTFYENDSVAQKQDEKGEHYIVQNPMKILTTQELDYIYELPFTRISDIAAIESVQFSVLSHRGCFGKCSFCSLFSHQGKIIQSRSKESILREIESFRKHPKFKGIIEDLGGPSANMYGLDCTVRCKDHNKSCIECKVQDPGRFTRYLELLSAVRTLPYMRHVYVRSGIRLDLLGRMTGADEEKYLYELCKHHVSGRLKVAPEHVNDHVLRIMNKGRKEDFVRFAGIFRDVRKRLRDEGTNVQLIPYFMAAHPGCSAEEMKDLKKYVETFGEIDQVQIFTPTQDCKNHIFTGEPAVITGNLEEALEHFKTTDFGEFEDIVKLYADKIHQPTPHAQPDGRFFC